MKEETSLSELFSPFKKHMWVIGICIFVGLGISAVVTFFIVTPKYSSQSQLIVAIEKTNDNLDTKNVNNDLEMINTYKELVKGDLVIDEVKKTLLVEHGIEKTDNELREEIEVIQAQDSLMFSIRVISESPNEAMKTANTTAKVFTQTAKEVLNIDKVSVISSAQANFSPVSPNKQINLLAGVILGLIFGIGISLVAELLDRRIKSDDFITELLSLSLLGNVSYVDYKELRKSKLINKQIRDSAKNRRIRKKRKETL